MLVACSRLIRELTSPTKISVVGRLLHFLYGPARSAVAGFEGVPGGLGKALKMLQQRFGQPHIVAKACVDALVDGPKHIKQRWTRAAGIC